MWNEKSKEDYQLARSSILHTTDTHRKHKWYLGENPTLNREVLRCVYAQEEEENVLNFIKTKNLTIVDGSDEFDLEDIAWLDTLPNKEFKDLCQLI